MKLCFNKFELEKSFGKKDLSKLTRKVITDKNGHQRTVFVRNDINEKTKENKNSIKEYKSKYGTIKSGEKIKMNHGGISDWEVKEIIKRGDGLSIIKLLGHPSVKPGLYKTKIKVGKGKNEWEEREALFKIPENPVLVTSDIDEILIRKNRYNPNDKLKLEPVEETAELQEE